MSIDPDQLSTWCLSDELNYLENIGTHTVLGRSPCDRRELLKRYQSALKYRPLSEKYLDFTRLHERVYELLNEGSATH